MTRKLIFPILFLAVCSLTGCSSVKEFFTVGEQSGTPDSHMAEYQPEEIMTRDWPREEVEPVELDIYKPSPYVTGYSSLDNSYPNAEYETWNKSNAKRAVADPFIFMKDVVTAPFKYTRDKYKEYRESKKDGKCSGAECSADCSAKCEKK